MHLDPLQCKQCRVGVVVLSLILVHKVPASNPGSGTARFAFVDIELCVVLCIACNLFFGLVIRIAILNLVLNLDVFYNLPRKTRKKCTNVKSFQNCSFRL